MNKYTLIYYYKGELGCLIWKIKGILYFLYYVKTTKYKLNKWYQIKQPSSPG